jgi:hypothetical protein
LYFWVDSITPPFDTAHNGLAENSLRRLRRKDWRQIHSGESVRWTATSNRPATKFGEHDGGLKVVPLERGLMLLHMNSKKMMEEPGRTIASK